MTWLKQSQKVTKEQAIITADKLVDQAKEVGGRGRFDDFPTKSGGRTLQITITIPYVEEEVE